MRVHCLVYSIMYSVHCVYTTNKSLFTRNSKILFKRNSIYTYTEMWENSFIRLRVVSGCCLMYLNRITKFLRMLTAVGFTTNSHEWRGRAYDRIAKILGKEEGLALFSQSIYPKIELSSLGRKCVKVFKENVCDLWSIVKNKWLVLDPLPIKPVVVICPLTLNHLFYLLNIRSPFYLCMLSFPLFENI